MYKFSDGAIEMVSRRFRSVSNVDADVTVDDITIDHDDHAIDFGDETKVVKVNPCYHRSTTDEQSIAAALPLPLPFKIAGWDYDAADDDEIELKAGDTVIILEEVDENWGRGKNKRTGEVGLYPTLYVE